MQPIAVFLKKTAYAHPFGLRSNSEFTLFGEQRKLSRFSLGWARIVEYGSSAQRR